MTPTPVGYLAIAAWWVLLGYTGWRIWRRWVR